MSNWSIVRWFGTNDSDVEDEDKRDATKLEPIELLFEDENIAKEGIDKADIAKHGYKAGPLILTCKCQKSHAHVVDKRC